MRLEKKLPTRLICGVLSVVLALTLLVPGIAEHQWGEQIRSFERGNPVYSVSVEIGTAQEELRLPDTLRAIVDIPEEMDVDTFVQADPIADTSSGSEDYDYYWYGYVAPKDASELVAAGERAIYTIYYADGELAYRVYGAIEGSENLWFACDEAGNITGAVLDIPVEWSGIYDSETAGTYEFTASVSALSPYRWNGGVLTASVQVSDGENADDGHDHDGDAAEPACTCGAQPDENGVTLHAEGCPLYAAEEPQCTCTLGIDEKSSLHDSDCPFYVRVAEDCHCGINGEPIDADNFPWAHQEDCVYFSPIECMCRELVMVEVEDYDEETGEVIGTHTDYLDGDFSHIHDPANRDCPLYGKDTVRIIKLDNGEESVMSLEDAMEIVAYQEGYEASDVAVFRSDYAVDQDTGRRRIASSEGRSQRVMYDALGCIEMIEGSEQGGAYDPELALYAEGTNDTQMRQKVEEYLPTSGNASQWLDYVRTRFQNDYAKWTWTDSSSVDAAWVWNSETASGITGSAATNPSRVPQKSGGEWTVYSGQQLRYALNNFASGDKIILGQDLDLNGGNYNWESTNLGKKSINFLGANHTIYNLGMYITGNRGQGFLYYSTSADQSLKIQNITFANAKLVYHITPGGASTETTVNKGVGYGGLFVCAYGGSNRTLNNVEVRDSMFVQTAARAGSDATGAMAALGRVPGLSSEYSTTQKCTVINTVVAALGHPGALLTFADYSEVTYSYAVGNRIYSMYGHHGGLFASCSAEQARFENCFASGEIYAQSSSGGFIAELVRGGSLTNCGVTGKLEAQEKSAGFLYRGSTTKDSGTTNTTVKNCYTTVLVGLRSGVSSTGGFICNLDSVAGYQVKLQNCYAAGEVGDFTVDLTDEGVRNSGGFAVEGTGASINNCYYDKQTTGMREWATSTSKTLSGVTGLLTSTSPKNGTTDNRGMTGGDFGLGTADWVYHTGYYPELKVFAEASTDNWGGGQKRVDLLKAYSKASVATVFLDTWESGYDWDTTGVRSAAKTSYNRDSSPEGLHHADKYTYDTVREIVSPFTVSSGTWAELISGGAKMQYNDSLTGSDRPKTVEITGTDGKVSAPGMNWFGVSEAVNEQTGSRPVRLIGYMAIDAGDDSAVSSGGHYDHRTGVQLDMIDSLKDNLVVGIDDDKVWSVAQRTGYPVNVDGSRKTGYYGVPTEQTEFSASHGAILNTEIWRVKKDDSGSYMKDTDGDYQVEYSVKVTGEGTSGGDPSKTPTVDEQKWNGAYPFFAEKEEKYVVSYYWQLKDGRYVTDHKVVTVKPSTHTLTVLSKDSAGADNSTALCVDAYDGDTTTTVSSTIPRRKAEKTGIPTGTKASAVWKQKDPESRIKSVKIELLDNEGTVQGSAALNETDLLANKTDLTVPTSYYYTTDVRETGSTNQKFREVSKKVDAEIKYVLEKADDGTYFIKLNRFYGYPGETGNGDGVTITSADSEGFSFRDMHYDIRITVVVEENAYVYVKKVVDGYTDAMEAQHFKISMEGLVETQMSLKHNETSGKIKVPVTTSGTLKLTETVPMEFTLKDVSITSTAGSATIDTATNTLTVHPGDVVTVTVTNQYTGQNYFKSRTGVENTFAPAS